MSFRPRPSLSFLIFRAAGPIVLGAFLTGCRPNRPPVEILAILPVANLSGSAGLDWISSAGNAILADQLANAPHVDAAAAAATGDAYGVHASEFLHTYLVKHAADLELHAAVESAASHRTIDEYVESGPASKGPLPLFDDLARRFFASARRWPAVSPGVLTDFAGALQQTSPDARSHAMQGVIGAAPGFAPAAILQAQTLLALGDVAGAARTATDALTHASDLDEVAHARLEYLAVSDVPDRRVQIEKLRAVSQLMPAHADLLRILGQLQFFARDFSVSAASFESAARIDPADPSAWNLLGYSRAFAGDLKGARAALESYSKLLSPGDPNALDSLGEASFFLGDFASAERNFIAAHERKPDAANGGELLKAAAARYFTGDLAGADGLFSRFAAYRKSHGDTLLFVEQAQWDYICGRHDKAMEALSTPGNVTDDARAYADAQLSTWKRASGDIPEAIRLASDAARSSHSQPITSAAMIARIFAQPPAQTSLHTLPAPFQAAIAGNLFLSGRYDQAVPILRTLLNAINPSSDGQVRTLLAACDVQTGQWDEARDLTRANPLPFKAGDTMLDWIAFPRWFAVKAAVLAHDGKPRAAASQRGLFSQYGGPQNTPTH